MGQSAKPWTNAIAEFLADGEWHDVNEALAVGAAVVPEDRALQEMGEKQSAQSNEKRISIGRRNVAMQAVTGMIRFGKAEYGDGKKQLRKVSDKSRSIGELAVRVDELEAKLAQVLDQLDSLQSQADRLDAASEGQTTEEKLLQAAGVSEG